MDNPSPLISIVMPALNAEQFIGEAIQSVLDQTYPYWELLIVNDGSTDGTEAVVRQYSDPRIRYIATPRLGVPAAVKNLGITHARGEFVTFQDSDDAFLPFALERLLAPLRNKPKLLASMGFPYFCDRDLNPVQISRHLQPDENQGYTLDPSYQLTWANLCLYKIELYLSGTLLRKSLIDRMGLLDEQMVTSEDFKYLVQVFENGFNKVAIVPDGVFLYRQHANSLTKDPDRLYRTFSSDLRLANWLFSRPFISRDLYRLKPVFLADKLSIMCRSLVKMHRNDLARRIIVRALQEAQLPLDIWLRYFWKQMLRAFAPRIMETLYMSYLAKDRWRYV
jgi:glycosyltransferase involved in cell wall biosynthesis